MGVALIVAAGIYQSMVGRIPYRIPDFRGRYVNVVAAYANQAAQSRDSLPLWGLIEAAGIDEEAIDDHPVLAEFRIGISAGRRLVLRDDLPRSYGFLKRIGILVEANPNRSNQVGVSWMFARIFFKVV